MSDAPRLKLCLFGKGVQKIQEQIVTHHAVRITHDRFDLLDPASLTKDDEDVCIVIPLIGSQYLLRYYYGLHVRPFPRGPIANIGVKRDRLIHMDAGSFIVIQSPECGFKLDGHRMRYSFEFVDATGSTIQRTSPV